MSEEGLNPMPIQMQEDCSRVDHTNIVKEADENSVDAQNSNNNADNKIDVDRIHVKNLPKFCGFKQFKKILEKSLHGLPIRKVRQMRQDAYVSFNNADDAQKAIAILDGLDLKKSKLAVSLALQEPKKERTARSQADSSSDVVQKTARQNVTPLADLPYSEQLQRKNQASSKLAITLNNRLHSANVDMLSRTICSDVLKEIKPVTKIKEYRNKCEFTIGYTLSGELCVGFVGGRFANGQHNVLPVDECNNISLPTHAVVKEFRHFVEKSGLEPLDEFARKGFWRMLTVRDFGADMMLIITVFPLEDKAKELQIIEDIRNSFLSIDTLKSGFRVTSLFWQVLENCSDTPVYQHVGGAPYIYESVLGCRFRVSPSAFFQTNSQAAATLYTTIGEACGFSTEVGIMKTRAEKDMIKPADANTVEGETITKKAKHDDDISELGVDKMNGVVENEAVEGSVLLDICCGTGTIGQCLLSQYGKSNKLCCVGIEMITSAVEDARKNAKDNGFGEQTCQYIPGKAEDVFRSLKYYLPKGFSLTTSRVVGVLDPPRAGMHEKVILGCRMMSAMKRLVFVSCDPSAAMKNIVDLCRPRSKKFDGEPFCLDNIQPVDMFPQTEHFEWVVTLCR